MANEFTLCFTGHRPQSLGGFSGPVAEKVKAAVQVALHSAIKRAIGVGYSTFISGGALGIDQWAARQVLGLREEFTHIKLIIARPFPSQHSKWLPHSAQEFMEICNAADQTVDVSPDPYSPQKMQVRNEWMVDRSHSVIAVYKGGTGGTKNCIDYTLRQGKYILTIDPFTMAEEWVK